MPGPEAPALLHRYLLRAGERFTDAPAIAENDKVISFGELRDDALALAAMLQARGLQKGDRVALLLPKTAQAITSVFGSLLAGAIYVPIQPRWPAQRIESTLEDCGALFLIRSGTLVDRETEEEIAWPDAVGGGAARYSEPAVGAEDPAFILFTSGSTGRPKGVTISHRAVSAFVQWSAREFEIDQRDRIACPAPLSFDLSTLDVFSMALCGATCVIVPEQIVWMPRFLTAFLSEQSISVWYSVPSILAGMLNEGGFARRRYPELRVTLFAGESFAARNLAGLQAAAPHTAFYNLYGPTETNVVTWYRVPPGFGGNGPIPIGGPCPYARLEVLREEDGSGELLVAGESLMTGYWNRPEETEKGFVVLDGTRYYRTGDRVARAAGGEYVFMGRTDRQVKRRGFRIELGEIEAALNGHPAVLEAAAVAAQDEGLGTVITAFLRAEPGHPPSQVELRTHCARALPSYMLPDRIVFLEVMPKGSRGKIDYGALRALVTRS